MRIKEFGILRYGPLPKRDNIELAGFNLLFGYNEEGKTLTIDALVKLLLGKSSRGFERINRVDEQPEGYLLVEKEGEEDIMFPDMGNLTRITGLTATELRNIFIIRDSDLSISREEDFYKDVTNRLVGLQTEEIDRIITELRYQSSLTLKGDFQNTAPRKLKSRLNAAAKLTDEIDEQIKKLNEINYEKIEEELWDTGTKLDNTEKELDLYEIAQKRDTFHRGQEALEKLENSMKTLKELSAFNREDEQEWQQCENNLTDYNNEIIFLSKRIEEEEKKVSRLEKSVETEQLSLDGLTRDKDQTEELLKPKIIEYKSQEQEIREKKQGGTGRLLSIAAPLATLVFIVSLAGVFLWENGQWAGVSVLLSLVIIMLYGGFIFYVRSDERRLSELLRKIESTASGLKIEAENADGFLDKINEFKEACSERENNIQELQKNMALSKQKKEELEGKLSHLEGKEKDDGKIIEAIKEKTNTENLQDYRNYLRKKEESAQSVKTQQGILANRFGLQKRSASRDFSFWKEKVDAFREYAGKAEGIRYKEHTVRKLKEKRNELKNRKQELGYKLEKYRKETDILERRVNDCLAPEDEHIPCLTVKDLSIAKDKLKDFISFHEKNREYAGEAINIFKQIGEEEEKKVQDLFGAGSAVSRYFREVTDNYYTDVVFNRDKGIVEVRRPDETLLEAWKLSGGTYDQLYLCIRLSLGGELLKGKKGFFILDDPFLKSDTRRLESQLKVLRKITEEGWQIIFFTAKDELKEALNREIESGEVRLIEI